MIDADLLVAVIPACARRIAPFINPLATVAEMYEITTPLRVAAWLAQLAHESGEFRYTQEIWGPTPAQARYEPPSSAATSLGNTQPGDGYRFRGRGLIQLTGRANYQAFSDAVGTDFVVAPEPLQLPSNATLSAGWFWDKNDLNRLADERDFRRITIRINGGLNGYAQRVAYYNAFLTQLGETP